MNQPRTDIDIITNRQGHCVGSNIEKISMLVQNAPNQTSRGKNLDVLNGSYILLHISEKTISKLEDIIIENIQNR